MGDFFDCIFLERQVPQRECLIRHLAALERQRRGREGGFDPCLACELAMNFREGNMSKNECVDCKRVMALVSHGRCSPCLRKARLSGVVEMPAHRSGSNFRIGKKSLDCKDCGRAMSNYKNTGRCLDCHNKARGLGGEPITKPTSAPVPPAQSAAAPIPTTAQVPPVQTSAAPSISPEQREAILQQTKEFTAILSLSREATSMLMRDQMELEAISIYLEIASSDAVQLAEFMRQPFVSVPQVIPLAERVRASSARYARAMAEFKTRCGSAT